MTNNEENILVNICNKLNSIDERLKGIEIKLQRLDDEEDLFKQAIKLTIEDNTIGAAELQRKLKIGYNKATRYIEMCKDLGIIE